MIRIFGQTDTTFTTNGDCVLIASKAVVHKYENSDYYLDLEASAEYEQYFEQGRLVVVDFLNTQQVFRMWSVTKTRNKVKAKCWHVFYDTKYIVWAIPSADTWSYSANTFYLYLDVATHGDTAPNAPYGDSSKFTVASYALHTSDFPMRRIDKEFYGNTLYDIIQNEIKTDGGFLMRDNFSFGISAERRTTDRGFTIRYGRNLKNIQKDVMAEDMCSTLIAVGKDKYCKVYNSPYHPQSASEFYFVKKVEFTQNINPSDYSSEASYQTALEDDLDRQAYIYMSENAQPKINYTLQAYVDNGEIQDIGDIVNVIDETLGVNVMTTVLGFDYDVLLSRFNSVQFGNYSNSMKGYNFKVDSKMSSLQRGMPMQTHPVGSSMIADSNPNDIGIDGYWQYVSAYGSQGVYKRIY